MSKGKDISTIYTKEQNEKCGRKGYYGFKREKEVVISPKDYGVFLQERKCKKWGAVMDDNLISRVEVIKLIDKYGYINCYNS